MTTNQHERRPGKYLRYLAEIFRSIGLRFSFSWPFIRLSFLLDIELLITWPGDLDFWSAQLPLIVALGLIVMRSLFNAFRVFYFELKIDEMVPPSDPIPWTVGAKLRVAPSGSSVYFPGEIVKVKEELLASEKSTGTAELFKVRYETHDHRPPQDDWFGFHLLKPAVEGSRFLRVPSQGLDALVLRTGGRIIDMSRRLLEPEEHATDSSVIEWVRHHSHVHEVDLNFASEITDETVFFIAERMHELETINLHGCSSLTERSIDRLLSTFQGQLRGYPWGWKDITDATLIKQADLRSASIGSMRSIDLSGCHHVTGKGLRTFIEKSERLHRIMLQELYMDDSFLNVLREHGFTQEADDGDGHHHGIWNRKVQKQTGQDRTKREKAATITSDAPPSTAPQQQATRSLSDTTRQPATHPSDQGVPGSQAGQRSRPPSNGTPLGPSRRTSKNKSARDTATRQLEEEEGEGNTNSVPLGNKF